MTAPRILVVEDERIIALHLRQQLTKLGYDVPEAVATGDHALRCIEEMRPDLVLMDINLKGSRDGIATAAAIPPAYRIPVVYLTAYSADATLERAAATHPYGYLLKPFSERELHATIQVALARCRAERASLASLESRRQARKMEALGNLASGLADEVNDLLEVMRGPLEVLGSHALGIQAPRQGGVAVPDLAEPMRDAFLEVIEKEALVHRLLDFSGRRKLSPTTVAVTDLVAGVIDQLGAIVGDTVRIHTDLPDGLWMAWIDPDQLARALANLAINAREAMPNGGSLTIEARNAILGEDDAEGFADEAAGLYVLLSITDSGTGMPECALERAFEPFFTTKPAGRGLGLSLVFGFIRQSGGHISIESKSGNGTIVRIYLPAASDHGDPDPLPRMVATDLLTISRTDIVTKTVASIWRLRGADRAPPVAAMAPREDSDLPVAWHQAENALYASILVSPGMIHHRLIVEPLPRRGGWDWAVWRPGDSGGTPRQGHASSVAAAMAAAETAARSWE